MSSRTSPAPPIPPPLRGNEPDSFAHDTITQRLPRIGRRVVDENDFAPEVEEHLLELVDELPHGKIRPLRDENAPDAEGWGRYVAAYVGENWLDVPWFFAETYFYRRILEATGYFEEGLGFGVDPFAPHKEQSLQNSRQEATALASRVAQWRERPAEKALYEALSAALWGNQGDLSMWPGGAGEMPSHDDAGVAQAHVLVDDREAAIAYLRDRRGFESSFEKVPSDVRIDIIEDNAGFEFISDLALVDVLLGLEWADRVILDVKFHPTFVSDVVPRDVRNTLEWLIASEDDAVRAWGKRLRDYADSGRIALRQHAFWTSPLAGWEMPDDVRDTLSEATLVIAKGDANYRRLLGDRHWDYTTPFDRVLAYFPAPLLALRTLKSNVAAGLDQAMVNELNERYTGWDVSGEWGLMQGVFGVPGSRVK